jgi:L-iditol 2-dehydrogenase
MMPPRQFYGAQASRVESSVCTAAYSARRGGKVVMIGVGKDIKNNLPFMHLSPAEVFLVQFLY